MRGVIHISAGCPLIRVDTARILKDPPDKRINLVVILGISASTSGREDEFVEAIHLASDLKYLAKEKRDFQRYQTESMIISPSITHRKKVCERFLDDRL